MNGVVVSHHNQFRLMEVAIALADQTAGVARKIQVLSPSTGRRGQPAAKRAAQLLPFGPDRPRRASAGTTRPGPQPVT